MYQLVKPCERIEVGKLHEPVLCEDEGLEVRYTCREVRLDVRYAVLSEEQCAMSLSVRSIASLSCALC